MDKIIFRTLLHLVVKMESIYQVLWMIQQLHVESYDEETKTIPTNFDKKSNL